MRVKGRVTGLALVGSFDLIHQLFNWLDFGPVPPSV